MIWKQPSASNVSLDEGDCHSWTTITVTSTSHFSPSVQSAIIQWLRWSFTEIQVGCVWQRCPHSMKLKCHRVRRTIQSWINDWWTGSKLSFFPKKEGSPLESHKDLFWDQHLPYFKAKYNKEVWHLCDRGCWQCLKLLKIAKAMTKDLKKTLMILFKWAGKIEGKCKMMHSIKKICTQSEVLN